MKTDNVSDATVLFPDTQEETPEDITTEDTIILDETDVMTTTGDTATNTISNEQEVDKVSELIERKFNVSDKKKGCIILKIGQLVCNFQTYLETMKVVRQ